jgi:N6-L-threonylcarbamoyladenine synthase
MKILAIETSCDETGAAIVEKTAHGNFKIISNITATSAGIHARTGGVVPEDAARKQIESLLPVIELTLKEAIISINEIDAIAVTVGPGLIGSLLVGVETAKTLSVAWKKPIIPVNHLVGHIYANWFDSKNIPQFPLVALAVSGGHTDLVYMENQNKIKYIGGTIDDAAGEAFDKTARLLGFDYPGGFLISKAADEYFKTISSLDKLNLFPRPMVYEKNFNWSFSGLKTAVLREVQKLIVNTENLKLSDYKEIATTGIIKKNRNRLAAEVQEAIVDSLVEKSLRGLVELNAEREIKSFLLAGGVSANKRLREKFQAGITQLRDSGKLARTSFHVPEIALCTDNAAPIAVAAFFGKSIPWQEIVTNPELTITD